MITTSCVPLNSVGAFGSNGLSIDQCAKISLDWLAISIALPTISLTSSSVIGSHFSIACQISLMTVSSTDSSC
jgi:hypothetical protein